MIKKILLPLITLYSLSYAVKDIWMADVSIANISKNLENKKSYTCSVALHNKGDDDAQYAKVLILLPLKMKYSDFNITKYENKVYLKDINCIASHEDINKSKTSYIECSMGHLIVDANISFDIHAQNLDLNRTENSTCSAFVYSASPDGSLGNNYAESK